MSKAEKTLVLGDEYDDALWIALTDTLRQLGATQDRESQVVVGSQDIDSFDVVVSGQDLHIESETYIGVSLRGPSDLVDTVAAMVGDQLRASGRL